LHEPFCYKTEGQLCIIRLRMANFALRVVAFAATVTLASAGAHAGSCVCTTTMAPTPAPMQDATPQCELTIRLYKAVENRFGGAPFYGDMVTSYKLQYKKCTHLPGSKPGEPAYEVSEAHFIPGYEEQCLSFHVIVRPCDGTTSSFTVFTDGMKSTCKNLLDGTEGYMCGGSSSRIVAPTPAPTTSLPSPACHTSVAGEDCYAGVQWAMEHGIHRHPQWYPNLSSSSSFADFQSTLHEGGHHNCPVPC